MKYLRTALFLAAAIGIRPTVLYGRSIAADNTAGLPRVVRVEGVVNAPVAEVWRCFTTSEGAMEFFAVKANIHLRLGGPYEIQFDPKTIVQGPGV